MWYTLSMLPKLKKLTSILLCFLLILQQTGFSQTIDLSGYFNQLSRPLSSDKFRPLHLRCISYDLQEDNFSLRIDKGSLNNPSSEESEDSSKTLFNYFLIGLSLPNDSFWVNLRPDSPDNIIDDSLARTDMGKIMLETDLQLKKDTAQFTSPQTPEGKVYWDKLYQKAEELYGTTNITIPTLTRPWIVPGEIIIGETQDSVNTERGRSAYVYKAILKVMLEEDYLTSRRGSQTAPTPDQYTFSDPRLKEVNEYSTQLIKELIIPKLAQEINSSKRYAPLRQVYYSLILAQHFKNKLRSKSGPYSNLIDSRDLTNLTSQESWDKLDYFKEYQKSFHEGEYNLKASQPTAYGQTVRRYMSGGVELGNSGSSALIIPAKNNRITDHPEMLKVSSAILPGNLKAAGRPAGNPIITYVSRPEDLRISNNLEIKHIWDEMVEENLRLYKFTKELTRITRAHGFINKFPNEELENLREFYNYLDHKDLDYNLGFITFNGGIEEGGGSRLAARFKFNLLFLVSMVNAGIEPVEFFNKKNSRFLLNDEEFLEKIVTGTQLGPEGKEHYVWIIFKDKIEYILGLGKGTTFIKQFGKFLFETFRQKRQSYDKIARFRYAVEKPHMAILGRYQSQLWELINSDSPRKWIERQELVGINTPEGEIGKMGYSPGPCLPGEDQGKVRKFRLPNGQEVYAKRIDPLR